jgi:hypothetical protein
LAAVGFRYPESYLAALVYYLAIVSVLMVAQGRLERHYTWSSARGRRIAAPAVPVPVVSHDAR